MPDAITESQRLQAQLRYPCGDVPDPGVIKNVVPGIYWLRMPLPFQLNHINLWLVEEKDGWTIVDTGINTQATRDLWEKIFAEKLNSKPVTRVIATHLHPDHVGLAGWLCERWNAPLLMTPIDRPAVYTALAAAPPGAACEVPLGIGDGLSTGIGSQERAALYYATVHGHPLVGGYIGRMPFDAQRRYEAMPVAGSLLRLSDGRPDAADAATEGGPCSFLIVNRAAITAPLRAYLDRLPLERLASDDARDLYRVNSKTAR